MNKKEIIKKIKEVVSGCNGWEYIAVAKKANGRGYEIVGGGLGCPVRENYGPDDMLFIHDRNDCTLREAEELLEEEIWNAEQRV